MAGTWLDARLYLEGSSTLHLNVIFLRSLQGKAFSGCPSVTMHQPFGLKSLWCPQVLMELNCVLCTFCSPSSSFTSPCTSASILLHSPHLLREGPSVPNSHSGGVMCVERKTDPLKTANRRQAAWVIFLKGNSDTILPVLKTLLILEIQALLWVLEFNRCSSSSVAPAALVMLNDLYLLKSTLTLSLCLHGGPSV